MLFVDMYLLTHSHKLKPQKATHAHTHTYKATHKYTKPITQYTFFLHLPETPKSDIWKVKWTQKLGMPSVYRICKSNWLIAFYA